LLEDSDIRVRVSPLKVVAKQEKKTKEISLARGGDRVSGSRDKEEEEENKKRENIDGTL
jgi:hypothetical protein